MSLGAQFKSSSVGDSVEERFMKRLASLLSIKGGMLLSKSALFSIFLFFFFLTGLRIKLGRIVKSSIW